MALRSASSAQAWFDPTLTCVYLMPAGELQYWEFPLCNEPLSLSEHEPPGGTLTPKLDEPQQSIMPAICNAHV